VQGRHLSSSSTRSSTCAIASSAVWASWTTRTFLAILKDIDGDPPVQANRSDAPNQ
jgi:hypothetical protein